MASVHSNLILHGLVFVYHDENDTPRRPATRLSTPSEAESASLSPSLEGGGQGEGEARRSSHDEHPHDQQS